MEIKGKTLCECNHIYWHHHGPGRCLRLDCDCEGFKAAEQEGE